MAYQTITVSSNPAQPTPIARAGDPPCLVFNSSTNNVYLSDSESINIGSGKNNFGILPALGYIVLANVEDTYACTNGQLASISIFPGGLSFFQLAEIITKILIISAAANNGIFEYSGTPGLGNLPILWANPPGSTTDPFGNTLPESGGLTVMALGGGLLAQLFAGGILFNDTLDPVAPNLNPASMQMIHRTVATANPIVAINSPAGDGANDSHTALWLEGAPTGGVGNGLQTWFFAESGSSFVNNLIGLVKGVLGFAQFTGGPPVPTLLGPAFTANGNAGILVIPNANAALPAAVSQALLEIQGALALTNQSSAPASVSGAAQPFASSEGHVNIVAGDGNQYQTETWYIKAPVQIISDVTPISNNIGPAINVGVGDYKIRITGILQSSVVAGIARVLFAGTCTQSGWWYTKCTPINGAQSFDGINNSGLFNSLQIANPLATTSYTFLLEGEFTVTVAGDIQFQGNTSAAADVWTWLNGTIELSPTG